MFQGAAAGGGQAVFGSGNASGERFFAGDVTCFFEFAGVDAEVAIGRLENAFEVVEGEGVIAGEGADDSKARALVDEAVEFRDVAGGATLVCGRRGLRALVGQECLALHEQVEMFEV